jgi:hypothetical protein
VYSLVRTVYDDHQQLATRLAELQEYAKNKKKYDEDLKWAQSETKHWQEAATRGGTQPDRKMNSEEESALFEALDRIRKDTKSKDFLTIQIAASCGKEPQMFRDQIWHAFDSAHWPVPPRPTLSKRQLDALNAENYGGVTIFTDQPQWAMFVGAYLRDAAHISSQVYSFDQVPPLKALNMKGTIIWVGDK